MHDATTRFEQVATERPGTGRGELALLREQLRKDGFVLTDGDGADQKLEQTRALYEPYALALADFLRLDLPPWIKQGAIKDNWKTTAWKPSAALAETAVSPEEHF